jgi:hypothetical protein
MSRHERFDADLDAALWRRAAAQVRWPSMARPLPPCRPARGLPLSLRIVTGDTAHVLVPFHQFLREQGLG